MKLFVFVFVFVSALALTACGASSTDDPTDDFRYGADDMKALVAGHYTGTLTPTGGAPTGATLDLLYAPPTPSPACGDRVLCVSVSRMHLTGTFTTADGAYEAAPVAGQLELYGTEISTGTLVLTLVDGAHVSFPVDRKVLVTDGELVRDGVVLGKLSLTRQ